MNRASPLLLLLLLLLLGLGTNACSGASLEVTATSTIPPEIILATPSPVPSPTPTATPPTPTNTPTITPIPPVTLWLAPYLPESLRDSLEIPSDVELVESPETADLKLDVGSQNLVGQWVYALAAPFPTLQDGAATEDLRSAWQGKRTGSLPDGPLLVDEGTLAVLSSLWGEPAAGGVLALQADEILDYAWDHLDSWAILPFETLEPRWKVLKVDGISPLHKDFDPATYALTASYSLEGDPEEVATTSAELTGERGLITNRDPDKLTTLVMTGVTALVRATAETMRVKGITYPAQDIGDLLREADLTHVSNEIPFTPDCPLAKPKLFELVFCTNPDYFALLEEIGTDFVELTGDHFNDWGPEGMRYTLDLYNEHNLPYYGGGYNEEEARKALLLEHNGNRIAFIGCNAKGGGYATARGENPGAIECDLEWIGSEIARLRAEGYLPIVTFQHFEYYSYEPQPKLLNDFREAAGAGAVIVSGSQAHQPHGMEFYQGAFVHYGLGNLFFDQYSFELPTDQAFIDRHVFYDGRHISTELIGIHFEDYARPRLMTPEEQEELLRNVFEASIW